MSRFEYRPRLPRLRQLGRFACDGEPGSSRRGRSRDSRFHAVRLLSEPAPGRWRNAGPATTPASGWPIACASPTSTRSMRMAQSIPVHDDQATGPDAPRALRCRPPRSAISRRGATQLRQMRAPTAATANIDANQRRRRQEFNAVCLYAGDASRAGYVVQSWPRIDHPTRTYKVHLSVSARRL